MLDQIRAILDQAGRLRVLSAKLTNSQDLFSVGLSSFAAVQVMLALEEQFDVEFPQEMMTKHSFESVNTIAACLHKLQAQAA